MFWPSLVSWRAFCATLIVRAIRYRRSWQSRTRKNTSQFQCGNSITLFSGRYLTVLYFLNDVEEGGETAFPVANNETFSTEVKKRTWFREILHTTLWYQNGVEKCSKAMKWYFYSFCPLPSNRNPHSWRITIVQYHVAFLRVLLSVRTCYVDIFLWFASAFWGLVIVWWTLGSFVLFLFLHPWVLQVLTPRMSLSCNV